MTKNQIVKTENEQEQGVILTERFVHRDLVMDDSNWFFLATPEEIIERLAEHLTLSTFELTQEPADSQATTDEMPRFQQSLRDGLRVPKEGKDGTGN